MKLLETVIAATIVSVVSIALFGAYNLYLRAALGGAQQTKVSFLVEEGVEAVKFLRNASWNMNIANISTSTDYYLVLQNNLWQLTGGNVLIDGIYERRLTISDVFRDASGNITTTGGTYDAGTKRLSVSVAWNNHGATTTKAFVAYIANIFSN